MSQANAMVLQLGILFRQQHERGAADAPAAGEQLLALLGEPEDDQSRIRVAELRTDLGDDYAGMGETTRAGEQYTKAIALYETALGKESPSLGRVLVMLAKLQNQCGHAREALATLDRAMVLIARGDTVSSADTSQALLIAGQILHEMGKLDAAEAYFRDLLARVEKSLGRDSIAASNVLNSLAIVLRQRSKPDEAIALYDRSIAILEQRGSEDGVFAGRLCNLATALLQKGDRTRARECVTRARSLVDVPEAPLTKTLARVLDAAADLELEDGGDPRQLIELRSRILRTVVEMTGPDSLDAALARNGLGLALAAVGRWAEALEHIERARSINVAIQGDGHPAALQARANELSVLTHMGRANEAEPAMVELLPRLESAFGHESGAVLDLRGSLAQAMRMRGDVFGAITVLSDCLRIRTKQLGALHPRNVDDTGRIGMLFREAGDHKEAARAFALAADVALRAYGDTHPKLIKVVEFLYEELVAKEDLDGAKRAATRLVRMHERRGSPHEERAEALLRLALVHDTRSELTQARKRAEEALKHEQQTEGFSRGTSKATYTLARLAVKKKEYARAGQLVDAMQTALEGTKGHLHLAQVVSLRASIAAAQGDTEAAEREWNRAYDLAGAGLEEFADLSKDHEAYLAVEGVQSSAGNHLINILLDRLKTDHTLDEWRKERLRALLEHQTSRLKRMTAAVERENAARKKMRGEPEDGMA